MVPLFVFVFQEISDCKIPVEIKMYKDKSDRKTIKGTKKLLGVMKAKKIPLFTHMTRLYLQHILRLISVLQLVECKQCKPFSWFPEKVANARRKMDNYPLKIQLSDDAKLKKNSLYGILIEDLCRQNSTKITRDQWVVGKVIRSPFFGD